MGRIKDYDDGLVDNPKGDLDLDVDAPDEVPDVLREAADRYYESAIELEGDWQDKAAGRPWEIIAKILEKAAADIKKKI
jgi:hypothetical protein